MLIFFSLCAYPYFELHITFCCVLGLKKMSVKLSNNDLGEYYKCLFPFSADGTFLFTVILPSNTCFVDPGTTFLSIKCSAKPISNPAVP